MKALQNTRNGKERVLAVDKAPSFPEDWGHESNFSTSIHYLLDIFTLFMKFTGKGGEC